MCHLLSLLLFRLSNQFVMVAGENFMSPTLAFPLDLAALRAKWNETSFAVISARVLYRTKLVATTLCNTIAVSVLRATTRYEETNSCSLPLADQA